MALVIADMFGIAGRRSELLAVLAEGERDAMSQAGCVRYTVAVGIADADHYVVVEQWRDEAALEAHYASASFKRFQRVLHGLLARPSEVTIHSGGVTQRPVPSELMDPRDAD